MSLNQVWYARALSAALAVEHRYLLEFCLWSKGARTPLQIDIKHKFLDFNIQLENFLMCVKT